ncbi:hypothetical protein ENBRE01_0146 [Enteropsectra breve]|nr:hypothetical protein ENBRE01_0146 [Enteropsectra breve]
MTISKTEKAFIAESVSHGLRCDSRTASEYREHAFAELDLPLADRGLRLSLGNATAEISVVFRSNDSTLDALNIRDENRPTFESRRITVNALGANGGRIEHIFNMFEKNRYFGAFLENIDDLLIKYKIGLYININVIQNDGNLTDIVFNGLKMIFSDIDVPNVKNISCSSGTHAIADALLDSNDFEPVQLSLPMAKSYAVIRDKTILDPSQVEEDASDCLIHTFEQNNARVFIAVEGCVDLDLLCSILGK